MTPIAFYRKVSRSKTLEHTEPYLFGVIAGLVVFCLDFSLPDDTSLLASSITAGSIIVGFFTTAMILVLSLQSKRMQQLRDAKYLVDLVAYIKEAIYLAVAFVGLNLLGYFVVATAIGFACAWMGLLVASFFAFRRVLLILLPLLWHE